MPRIVRQVQYGYVTYAFGQTVLQAVPYDATRIYLAIWPANSGTTVGVSMDPNASTSNATLVSGFTGAAGRFELSRDRSPELCRQAWLAVCNAPPAGPAVVWYAETELILPDREPDVGPLNGVAVGQDQYTVPGEVGGPDPVTTWTQQLRRWLRRCR